MSTKFDKTCSEEKSDVFLENESSKLEPINRVYKIREKGTSRQRSGKGAIRKRFPLQKPTWEKLKMQLSIFLTHKLNKIVKAFVFDSSGCLHDLSVCLISITALGLHQYFSTFVLRSFGTHDNICQDSVFVYLY